MVHVKRLLRIRTVSLERDYWWELVGWLQSSILHPKKHKIWKIRCFQVSWNCLKSSHIYLTQSYIVFVDLKVPIQVENALNNSFLKTFKMTFFIHMYHCVMVPTGLIVAVQQNTNSVSTVCSLVCTLDICHLLFCFPSLSTFWTEQLLSKLQTILFKSLGVWFNCPYQTGGHLQTYKSRNFRGS